MDGRRESPSAQKTAHVGDSRLPWTAGVNLRHARFFVQTAFAALLEFEVLHRVGDVDILAADGGIGKSLVERSAGGTHEGVAFEVFLVARLFADEDHARFA